MNAAVVPLSAGGGISIALGVSGGDVILDTNGYYASVPSVSTLNAQSGDLTLVAGANVTLTSGPGTLTIASSASGGSGYVLKTGDTMTGSLALTFGSLDLSTQPSTLTGGNILKGGTRFIHTHGSHSTFVGFNAGNFTLTGSGNTGIGEISLATNTSGNQNTAVGYSALNLNASGSYNTAMGTGALSDNSTGSFNTALGNAALIENSSGNNNTAVGYGALNRSFGSDNTALGAAALGVNDTPNGNSAVGSGSLGETTTGAQNTAIGFFAGARVGPFASYLNGTSIPSVTNTSGSYNSFLGYASGAIAVVNNCTAVGIDSYCDGDNQVRLGNTFVSSIGGKVGFSSLSDARAKVRIRDLETGLELILRLRPVSYSLKNGNGRTDMGFVAQDVEEVLGTSFNALSIGGDADRTLSLRYQDFIAPLVKAVQEQQRMLEDYRQLIQAQEDRLERLERRLAERAH